MFCPAGLGRQRPRKTGFSDPQGPYVSSGSPTIKKDRRGSPAVFSNSLSSEVPHLQHPPYHEEGGGAVGLFYGRVGVGGLHGGFQHGIIPFEGEGIRAEQPHGRIFRGALLIEPFY